VVGTVDSPAQAWARYRPWNGAVAAVVFDESAAGVPTYLDMEDDVLRLVAAQAGVDTAEPGRALAAAVRPTLDLGSWTGHAFAEHLSRVRAWRLRASDEAPPVLALLAVLSMAAELMGDGRGFAANDYYGRLQQLLDVSEHGAAGKLQRDYRDAAEELWGALNLWLERMGGARGLPTAYALGHRYIGLPLSQALVRSHDRNRLRAMFGLCGLPPGYHMSPADMEQLLDGWLRHTPSPCASLARLWHHRSARERIAAVAALELESWDGSPEHDVRATGRLQTRLTGLVRTFPTLQVEFGLAVRVPNSSPTQTMEVISATTAGGPPAIEFTPLAGDWMQLPPEVAADVGALLEGVVRLRDVTGDGTAEHRPRRLVPFRYDDLLMRYVETERLQLGDDSLLVAQSSVAGAVSSALPNVARPGHQRHDAGVGGLPAGWVLFTDVQLVSAATPAELGKPDDLNVLAPVASSVQLTIGGGLQLPGMLRRWSSLCPPEVRAISSRAGALRVRIARLDDSAKAAPLLDQHGTAALVVPLTEAALPDGDYTVLLSEDDRKEPSRQQTLRLRSADEPDPVAAHRLETLVHDLSGAHSRGGLSASAFDGQERFVRGPLVVGRPDVGPSAHVALPTRPGWPTDQAEQVSVGPTLVAAGTPDPSACVATGAHHFDLPPAMGRGGPAMVAGECRKCGLVKRFPTSHLAAARWTGRRTADATSPVLRLDVHALAPVTARQGPSWDAGLDGLGYLGSGRAASLSQVALQVEPSALFADTYLRALEALGHVEVERDIVTLAPVRWSITPACLAGLPDGRYCLVGRWPHRLRQSLRSAVAGCGGSMLPVRCPQGPTTWLVDGLPPATVGAIAEDHDAVVVEQAAERLARALPALTTLQAALPHVPLPDWTGAKRFDVVTASWVGHTTVERPGAYRLGRFATLNAYRSDQDVADGTVTVGTVHLVKHLAAGHARTPLLAYHRRTRSLLVPLGADLPGLYGRAAVLSSGRLPTPRPRHRLLQYHDVPETTAQLICARLLS
jgi:hypothetical protein